MGMMECCGMAVKRIGMVGVSVRKMEGTDCDDGDSDTDW